MLLSKLERFVKRFFGTMDTRCNFWTRVSIISKTTWRHCWSYDDIRRMLNLGRYDNDWPSQEWELEHVKQNCNNNEKTRQS